jgi:hypothetical protein
MVLSAGAVLALTLVLARDKSVDRTFAGLLLTAQLISPLGWIYYLWFAAGPLLALLWSHRHRARRSSRILLTLAVPGLVWPLVWTSIWHTSVLGTVTFGSIYWWSTLFLWALVIFGYQTSRTVPVEGTR